MTTLFKNTRRNLLAVKYFTGSGTYTKTPGTDVAIIQVLGGGTGSGTSGGTSNFGGLVSASGGNAAFASRGVGSGGDINLYGARGVGMWGASSYSGDFGNYYGAGFAQKLLTSVPDSAGVTIGGSGGGLGGYAGVIVVLEFSKVTV